MPDTRTISRLEAEGYPWIGCECCKGTVWVPSKMIREKIHGGMWAPDRARWREMVGKIAQTCCK